MNLCRLIARILISTALLRVVALFPLFLGYPSEARSEFRLVAAGSSDRIIIFIHGLWGDPIETFRGEGVKNSWPELIATDNEVIRDQLPLSHYATAVLGYPAAGGDSLSIPQISTRLLLDLEDAGVFEKYRHIVFIAHSLGGLALKQMMQQEARGGRNSLYEKTRAIFFLSTPSQGAPAANFIALLPEAVSGRVVADLKTIDLNTYLQGLELNWTNLLRSRSPELLPRIHCAYETKAIKGLTIVPQQYASTVCDSEPRAENADHITIAKPSTIGDSVYIWVRGRIAALPWQQMNVPQIKPGEVIRGNSESCYNDALKQLRGARAFSRDLGVRCEGGGLAGVGQKKEEKLIYVAPPGYQIVGPATIRELSRNNGSAGAITYSEEAGIVRSVQVVLRCESADRYLGAGAWIELRLEGQIERLVGNDEKNDAAMRCK